MANWVCRSFDSVYEPCATLRGGRTAARHRQNGHNRAHYHVPEIRVAYPFEVQDQGVVKRKPMHELIEEPRLLEFLTAPEKHTVLIHELYRR